MEVMIQNPKYLFLFWAVLAVALLVAAGLFIRRRNIRRFVAVESQSAIWPGGIGRRWPALSAALFITAMLAVVLGLADVRWGQTWTEVPQRGIDIVFALDVSRSMLARDVSPDRLTRAKEYIRDILAQMGGDRVGLVIFAGRPRQVLPLTSDYDEALAVLEDISPQSLSRGGSLIGDAIRAAAGCFSDKTPDHKAIVVLTDGEDQDSYPVMAARRAFKERGIRVYTVGLGDSRLGGRIPVRTTKAGTIYLKHKGQIVWSKMNGKLLRQIALAGGGAYIPAGTSQADMAGVYRKYIRAIHQREFRQGRVMHYIPRYRWFVGPAAILLMIELLLSGGSVRRQGGTGGFFSAVGKGLGRLRSNRTSAGIVFVALAAILLSPGSLRAKESSAGELTHRGNIALKAGRPAEAMEAYKQAIKLLGDEKRYRAQLSYNQALALYRQGKYDQAQASLRGAMGEADRWLEARARYNMGNCLYASALPLSKKNKTQAIKQLQQAIKQYRKALAIKHNFSPDDEEAVWIIPLTKYTKLATTSARAIGIFVAGVGILTLAIGSVGVTNMMLVSVSERIEEIGIRRATGATKYNIIWQFLTETLLLTVIAGGIGFCLGMALLWLVTRLPIPDYIPTPIVSFNVAVVAIIVMVIAGVLAGITPARRAAAIAPADAIKGNVRAWSPKRSATRLSCNRWRKRFGQTTSSTLKS